ncbi:hypothetical protein [Acidithiobacillus sp. AMEEHan]|uniref:hypothetical protein n=1 Tax=Acidithiobacillus sp. AMEEHan TaxID=2994951 RepID=UPI0027E461C5|nr:hypothetical protein [Acidithiobacillus sp. AMEEHan]
MAKPGGWGIGIVAAALVAGAFFYLTAQPQQSEKTTPRTSATKATHLHIQTVALGSYGSAVRRNDQELALEIHPLVELEGPPGESPPSLNGPAEQEVIGNTFLRFPELAALPEDSAAQEQLAKQIGTQLEAQLRARHSPWKLRSLQLRPSLGPIPSGEG